MSNIHTSTPLAIPNVFFKDAMKALGVSRSTLYRMMWNGRLTGYKIGATWRFYPEDLEAIPLSMNVFNPARASA